MIHFARKQILVLNQKLKFIIITINRWTDPLQPLSSTSSILEGLCALAAIVLVIVSATSSPTLSLGSSGSASSTASSENAPAPVRDLRDVVRPDPQTPWWKGNLQARKRVTFHGSNGEMYDAAGAQTPSASSPFGGARRTPSSVAAVAGSPLMSMANLPDSDQIEPKELFVPSVAMTPHNPMSFCLLPGLSSPLSPASPGGIGSTSSLNLLRGAVGSPARGGAGGGGGGGGGVGGRMSANGSSTMFASPGSAAAVIGSPIVASPLERTRISGRDQLQRYLADYSEENRRRTDASESALDYLYSRSFAQTSVPYHASPQAGPSLRAADDSDAAGKLLLELGIADRISEWATRARRWCSQHLVEPLAVRVQRLADTPSASQNQMRVLYERQVIDQYLSVPGYSGTRDYVRARVMDLARGGFMGTYTWDSGRRADGTPWSSALPTDCALLMHLLCTYFDFLIPRDSRAANSSVSLIFSNHYLSRVGSATEAVVSRFRFEQVSVNPPHYRIIVDKDSIWEVCIGGNDQGRMILHDLEKREQGSFL